jgi:predicted nucleic acid-binding protein
VAYLLDTNVLVRLASSTDASHAVARRAVRTLRQQGETLSITPQCLIGFRSVATRPTAVNGLGADAVEAQSHLTTFDQSFQLLPDTPDIFPTWKSLVTTGGVIGKQVHDARLVAVCHVHGVSHLLTFNTAHFARFATIDAGIVVVDPASV